jgi:tetratricopeptide (TPR) repeat protein
MKKSIIRFTGILLLVLNQFVLTAQQTEDAVALSQSGKYAAAEKIFSRLILQDNKNVNLLVASGYNLAWNKEYATAKQRFLKGLQLQPANTDAAKGLAYTYLYEGNYVKAADHFEKLSKADINSQELHIAAGLAYMNLYKKGKALKHFEYVLKLNKNNTEAKKYIAEIISGRGIVELSSLAGLSNSGNQSKFGLRQLQAGYHINSENFIYARYDNALSLDNYFLQKNNFSSNALMGGLYSRWHPRIGSKLEYGNRKLPGNIQQNMYQTEQLIFLPKNYILKLGGSMITSNQPLNEWMLMTGVSVPLSGKVKLEPHYYFIHREANEHRLMLNTTYHFTAKTGLAIGLFAGKEKDAKLDIDNRVSGAFAYSDFYIKGPLSGTALTRYEKDATGRKSFIAAAGIKLSIHTK